MALCRNSCSNFPWGRDVEVDAESAIVGMPGNGPCCGTETSAAAFRFVPIEFSNWAILLGVTFIPPDFHLIDFFKLT